MGTPWTRRFTERESQPERASMRLARACSRALAERPDRVWTISAMRMKAKREHRVPLCGRALEVLDAARKLGDGNHALRYPLGDCSGRGPRGDRLHLLVQSHQPVDDRPPDQSGAVEAARTGIPDAELEGDLGVDAAEDGSSSTGSPLWPTGFRSSFRDLGGRGDGSSARGHRGGAGPRGPEQGGGGVCAARTWLSGAAG